jgi:8-oxo-dGTP pyrophosphatase MutT (NUDIX family)
VRTSSAFPSAHVFPGGNLSPADGPLPASGTARHTDKLAYRTGAIRELFEESGILLARDTAPLASNPHPTGGLISVSARDRLGGRRATHSEKVGFASWLKRQSPSARLDTENLIPFTHWITPPNVPKRFSTQMYLYFVPVGEEEGNESLHATSDEKENTAAEWKSASEWIGLSRRGEIILFPPQFLLLLLASEFLDRGGPAEGRAEVEARREALRRFVESDGTPPWRDKYISPLSLLGSGGVMRDGRTVLAIDAPGLELEGSGLRGDSERVIFVKFRNEGPREVDVGWRREVEEDQRRRVEEERRRRKEKGEAKI